MNHRPVDQHLLPRVVPLVIAASIAGLSPATFRKTVLEAGRVTSEDGQVTLSSLAIAIGRPIEAQDYLRAQRSRDRARDSQRAYQRGRRAA